MSLWECTFATETMGSVFVASGQWWQNVIGHAPLPGAAFGSGSFQLQVSEAFNPNLYVSNAIVPSWPGGNGPVMFQGVIGSNFPADPAGQARSNWVFDPDLETYGVEWTQNSRIQIQSDLLAALDDPVLPFNFHQLWECKVGPEPTDTTTPTMSMSFGVVWHSLPDPGKLWWALGLRMFDVDGNALPEFFNVEVEAPAFNPAFWFDLEIFVRFSQTDGRCTVKINNVIVGDYSGFTIDRPPADCGLRWKLASLYTALDRGNFPHTQVVDSISLSVPTAVESGGAATSRSRKPASIVRAVRASGTSRGKVRALVANAPKAASVSRGWRRASDAVSS